MMRDASGRKYWGVLLITIGVAFAAAGLTFWFAWGFPDTSAPNQLVLGIIVHVLFGYIVVMSGITIYRSDLAVDEALIAAKWCLAGLVFMSALIVWSRLGDLAGGPPTVFFYEIVVVGSVGAAAGVLIGLNRGQAVQNARLVEERGDQQETLRFVLQLLRHDTQNDLTTVSGYVDLLEDEVDTPEGRRHLEHLQQRTESMRDLFGTAGTILESETGRVAEEVVNLSAVLRDQAAHVESIDGVTVDLDIEDDLRVEADPLIDELFRNVVENAVSHNPTAGLTVTVSAEAVGDEIEVVVADDGGGIPETVRDDVFDPEVRCPESEGDGLGLYLARKLAESYGGSIGVSDVEPSETRFTICLPVA